MTYFRDHYASVSLKIADGDQVGLRRAQIGAIHAVSSHFTLHDDPALVAMPTGSGKTAVLMLTAFLLRAERVLVITPSKLVRDQIVEEFSSLRTLKKAGVIHDALATPSVIRVATKRTTKKLWRELAKHDVSVSTPFSVSPGLNDVPEPPADLFDLILCDEAHHSPAKTWIHVLQAFPKARKVLFTATPFRRDRREIPGRFVYAYPVRRAFEDGIFGNIEYVAVRVGEGQSSDAAIAIAAESALAEDKRAGLNHCLMVRTDRKKRADELAAVYAENTGLRLEVVHSNYSYRTIKATIQRLISGELDGIICVAMLGEGFDLPQLKIAAIHVPHRSLEVTLQFIGRFARTNAADIGDAKFLAVPNDIRHETERLYREGSTWPDVVANLSESKVSYEANVREEFSKFDVPEDPDDEIRDISLYGLRPFSHVKIYELTDDIDVTMKVEFPNQFEVVYRAPSAELSATVIITRETEQPRWSEVSLFERSQHDLFVVYYHADAKLLFINSSRRTLSLYEHIAREFTGGRHRILPLYKISRVLRQLKSIECFNIGMRNRVSSSSVETYRIMTGSHAQRALGPSDGRMFHRGHVYVRAIEAGEAITLGYSSGSKVWANQNVQIPTLLAWCETLGDKIADDAKFKTGGPLDNLSTGEKVTAFPEGPIAVDWAPDAYRHSFRIKYQVDGESRECDALDCDLTVDVAATDESTMRLSLALPDAKYEIEHKLPSVPFFKLRKGSAHNITVIKKDDEVSLLEYFNNHPPSIYFGDFSRVTGEELFSASSDLEPFNRQEIVPLDWQAGDVDIELEFGGDGSKASIQQFLGDQLVGEAHDIVFYDHGTGEIADYVAIEHKKKEVIVSLYHCKASGGKRPGDRVGDVYEVCGQVVKSMLWLEKLHSLLDRIRRRQSRGSTFLKGDITALENIVEAAGSKQLHYRICLVQPGISAAGISEKGLHVLAAANDYVNAGAIAEMLVIASK